MLIRKCGYWREKYYHLKLDLDLITLDYSIIDQKSSFFTYINALRIIFSATLCFSVILYNFLCYYYKYRYVTVLF